MYTGTGRTGSALEERDTPPLAFGNVFVGLEEQGDIIRGSGSLPSFGYLQNHDEREIVSVRGCGNGWVYSRLESIRDRSDSCVTVELSEANERVRQDVDTSPSGQRQTGLGRRLYSKSQT